VAGAKTSRTSLRLGGFSLIEMIGVMAVMAISVAMLLPVLTQSTDTVLATAEVSTLQSFSTALQLNIQRNHVIPNITNWGSIVATEMGMTTYAVTNTTRGQQRWLLVDSNGFANFPPLPYVETSAGITNPFGANGLNVPRFIILSSLGATLPNVVSNVYPLQSDFVALWTNQPGNVPQTVPWINPTWSGHGSDLTIQRVNLSYIFAHLVLNNLDATNATYSINGAAPINLGPYGSSSNTLNSYYLTATVLNLYMPGTSLEACQVLNHDSSWVYSQGCWRNAPAPAPSVTATNSVGTGSGTTVSVGGCVSSDPGDCCHQFNWQRFCTNCVNPWNGCNPNNVCNDFTNYMNCYQQYAASGFSSHTYRNQLQSCCNQLNNDCGNLCHTPFNH
jgi:type II secretory pathway pseudopilin PulG